MYRQRKKHALNAVSLFNKRKKNEKIYIACKSYIFVFNFFFLYFLFL